MVRCTASWGKDGAKELEGLDALKDADLMLVFTRRMKLGEAQMALIRSHWEQGKAIIGIRTAGHAFQKADNEIFDRQVLGGHYRGHYGNEPIKVINKASGHPVLEGVEPFTSTKLYKAGELAKDTVVLQMGDIGKDRHPVTIVHEYKGGRTFFTSLGVPADFENENFRQMLVNAVDLRPDDGYIVDSLGWVYYRLGEHEEAVIHLERAVELRPQDPVINDHLGDAYWRVGRHQEARFQWRRALSLAPEADLVPTIEAKIEGGLDAVPNKI